MSSDANEYHKWLKNYQYKLKPKFVNNYWCAVLAERSETYDLDGHKFPFFLLEEELKKENNDPSSWLNIWICHLHIQHCEGTTLSNRESNLRKFLNSCGILPDGVSCPLENGSDFNHLPTACKVWILCALMEATDEEAELRGITRDNKDNEYYVLSGGKLYVKMAGSNSSVENDRQEAWSSLHRYVTVRNFKLLSTNVEEWRDSVGSEMQRCNMNKLYGKLKMAIEDAEPNKTKDYKMLSKELEFSMSELRDKYSDLESPPKYSTVHPFESVSTRIEPRQSSLLQQLQLSQQERSLEQSPRQQRQSELSPQLLEQSRLERSLPQSQTQQQHESLQQSQLQEQKLRYQQQYMQQLQQHQQQQQQKLQQKQQQDSQPIQPKQQPRKEKCPDEQYKQHHTPGRFSRMSRSSSQQSLHDDEQPQQQQRAPVSSKLDRLTRTLSKQSLNDETQWKPAARMSRAKSRESVYESADGGRSQQRRQGPRTNMHRSSSRSSVHNLRGSTQSVASQASSVASFISEDDMNDARRRARCLKWPRCKKDDCIFMHPIHPCQFMPDCRYGGACRRVHGPCPDDGRCSDEACIYDHYEFRRGFNVKWCIFGTYCNKKDKNCRFKHVIE